MCCNNNRHREHRRGCLFGAISGYRLYETKDNNQSYLRLHAALLSALPIRIVLE